MRATYLLRGLTSSARLSKACRRGVVVEAVEEAWRGQLDLEIMKKYYEPYSRRLLVFLFHEEMYMKAGVSSTAPVVNLTKWLWWRKRILWDADFVRGIRNSFASAYASVFLSDIDTWLQFHRDFQGFELSSYMLRPCFSSSPIHSCQEVMTWYLTHFSSHVHFGLDYPST